MMARGLFWFWGAVVLPSRSPVRCFQVIMVPLRIILASGVPWPEGAVVFPGSGPDVNGLVLPGGAEVFPAAMMVGRWMIMF